MLEIEKPKIECIEADERYGKFVVEPLERGYGITLGNSLRRVLLSSLPGGAVTSIQVEGVLHEFSTVPGVVAHWRLRLPERPERRGQTLPSERYTRYPVSFSYSFSFLLFPAVFQKFSYPFPGGYSLSSAFFRCLQGGSS